MSLTSLEDKVKKTTPRKLVEMDNKKRNNMKIKALIKEVQHLNMCFRKSKKMLGRNEQRKQKTSYDLKDIGLQTESSHPKVQWDELTRSYTEKF